jgi:hypothetical protein
MNAPPAALPPHKTVHVHKLIRATAIEMAASLYSDVMRDNRIYAQWKKVCPELSPNLCEAMFLELMWPKLIPKARATLASMLGGNYPEEWKQEVYCALIDDNGLIVGRNRHQRRQLRKQVRIN